MKFAIGTWAASAAIAVTLGWAPSPANAQTIKVGILGPFSGPFAHYGALFKNGAEAYIASQEASSRARRSS